MALNTQRNYRAFLKKLEDAIQAHRAEGYEQLKAMIIEFCDKRKLTFCSAYFTQFFKDGVEVAPDATEKLLRVILDFDDMFGFPDCKYENGVWTD